MAAGEIFRMHTTKQFVAKSVEEATEAAWEYLKTLGIPKEEATLVVLEEPQKALFGLISKGEGKVEIKYTKPRCDQAVDYLRGVLKEMGLEVEVTGEEVEKNSCMISIHGGDVGTIIGRRGETLDALQYLTSMVTNRGEKDYYRVTVDSNGYREKRRATLEELANKIAKSVIRTGRSTALEPMNPYERRIIHSVISEIEGVTSKSSGEEPYRKVIISSKNPSPVSNQNQRSTERKGSSNSSRERHDFRKNTGVGYAGGAAGAGNRNSTGGKPSINDSDKEIFSENISGSATKTAPIRQFGKPSSTNNRTDNRQGNRGNAGRAGYNGKPAPYIPNPPKSLDLATSFEKEYQKNRPKPKFEDDLADFDLYGVITFDDDKADKE